MADYAREIQRFTYGGMCLLPQDALPPGKVAYALNIRSYQTGTITVRYGNTLLTSGGPLAAPISSIFRLNDTTPYAGGGAPERRILTAGTVLYGGTPGVDVYGVITPLPTSGNPITGLTAAPVNSPRPWFYVGDSVLSRKVNSDLSDAPIGLSPPLLPPETELAAPQSTFLASVGVAAWSSYGGTTSAVVIGSRINTTVAYLLYDDGVDGMATVGLMDMHGVTQGATIDIGAAPETIIVQDVLPPVSPTTIGSILYDVGTNGLCTIQPDGSFALGQIELPNLADLQGRHGVARGDAGTPPAKVQVQRTIDYPVDALILLGGIETVRILSIALGNDGKMSFRCSTVGTFVATDAIEGIASLRAYFNTTKAVGDIAVTASLDVTVTPGTADPTTGGVQLPIVPPVNWNGVGTQATQPDDIIRLGVLTSQFGKLKSLRLILGVEDDGTGGNFLTNYYFYEWRSSDLKDAVMQATGEAAGLVADAQTSALRRADTAQEYDRQYGYYNRTDPGGVDSRRHLERFEDLPRYADSADRPAVDGGVPVGSVSSRQMALGDSQWMTLQCRVRDLTRIGTEVTQTLGAIYDAAIIATVDDANGVAIDFSFTDVYLTGGYGPDVAVTLAPYVYRSRYRSTITGEKSNPSPPMRAGVRPRRGRVTVTADASDDAQCDVVDFFRYGGALSGWSYAGTAQNNEAPLPSLDDDLSDSQIDGGEALRTDQYQPWPTIDLPRSGTVNVAGTAVEWVSGDQFNGDWAPGSQIIIDGKVTTLFQQPTSTTRLYVTDNIGTGAAVAFSLPSPTLLGQALPALWGGPINNVWFNFACGDPSDPSLLHWTHGNDPDATSDANTLVVSSASEPLQNGFYYDGVPYVFSTDKLYRIIPTFGDVSTFRAQETPCTRGLWSRWAFCITPFGIVFLAKDGIYITNGGDCVSITEEDLKILFPQDGGSPETIRNLNPVDFSAITLLKLTYVDSMVYFDYQDTEGELHTLVFEPGYKRWTPDTYAMSGVTARLGESGPQVHDDILGCADGNLYQTDADNLFDDETGIPWIVWTAFATGQDPRAQKQWGDAVLNCNPASSTTGITVTPVTENGNLPATTIGIDGLLRDTFIIDIDSGVGVISENLGLIIEGNTESCDSNRPLLYYWEPASLFKQVNVAFRATDWDNLGYQGAKFVQGVIIRANTYGLDKILSVQADGATVLSLTINHNGEQQIAYPSVALSSWTPFLCELVRLLGADENPWALIDWRWVWEPAPELATQWETQETTFDQPGFVSVRDGVIAYSSAGQVTLRVYHDLNFEDYTLAATGSVYARAYVPFAVSKGKYIKFRLTSNAAFRVYKRDCSVRVQPWGRGGGYLDTNPFGGPSRVDGAGI